MNILERTTRIIELLGNSEYLTVDELAEKTGSSKTTIRRDLIQLEAQGKVSRFHGGVSLAQNSELLQSVSGLTDSLHVDSRIQLNHEDKKRIAAYAAGLIHDGDIIYLDGGSTTYYLIDHLAGKKVSVVTNNIYHAMRLNQKYINTHILGGDLFFDTFSAISPDTISKVANMNFDFAFLGVRGIDAQSGISTSNPFDAELKSEVLKRSKGSYILADPSKFGHRQLYTIANLDSLNIITTDPVSDEYNAHIIYA